jgi:hypothetical protein
MCTTSRFASLESAGCSWRAGSLVSRVLPRRAAKVRSVVSNGVAYRDSFPNTIMTRVKSVPLLPCWTWAAFLILCLEWSACLSDPAKSLVVEPDRNFSKILVFRRVLALCFRQ